MGETTATMAGADPGRDYLAVETHVAGIANLLALIDDAGLTNVRVAHGDALDLLARQVRPASLDAVHVFFPDPWPKLRHHKRRIIQPDNVALMRSRLALGGVLHCATDWEPYAQVMLQVVDADPELANAHGGFAPRPADRPLTKFERRGITLGHDIFDIVVRKAP
jgi:tRNA (guanine-N7-)-methyltransferase